MRVLEGVLLVALAFAGSAQAGELARETAVFPEVPPPPAGSAQWIARSMRMNGLAMTLQAFQSRLPADAVLSHYESWSRTRGHGESRRSRSAQRQQLSLDLAPYLVTIEAQALAGRTVGTILVSKGPKSTPPRTATAFPRPGSTRVVNLQQFEDDGVEAEHISLISQRAPHVEAQAFARVLEREDWVLIREQPMQQLIRGRVLEAQKGAQLASITIFPDQSSSTTTAVLIVWKKL
jgi:hypothetical protein